MQKRRPQYFRDDEFLRKIGANIRKYRLKKGMTMTDLAFACNDIDYSQINRMELGKVNFSISYLTLIAKILDITPEDLIK
jgi:transcriptional regulator with XRE-family HTH domain